MSVGEVPTKGAVDRDACMGSGNCLFWAPGVFDLDDDGIAVVVGDPAGQEEAVREGSRQLSDGRHPDRPAPSILNDVGRLIRAVIRKGLSLH